MARDARRSRLIRFVARSGYVASGVLRTLIGVFSLLLAARVHGPHADASGVFEAIRGLAAGVVLLIVLAAGEYALAFWLVLAGLLHHDPRALERWRKRFVYWGRATVYFVIGTIASRFALGAHDTSGSNDREASRHLLDVPGGAVVLGLIGAVIVISGIGMMWIGAFLRFRRTVHLPHRPAVRRAVVVVAVIGYVMQGATIAVVGVFVVIAAITLDPNRAAGLNGTIGAFTMDPLGRMFLVLLGAGWVAAGTYALIRSGIARLA